MRGPRPVHATLTIALVVSLAALPGAHATSDAGELHLPSPDWRDQVVYFLMLDRFDDGDPSNNDQGAGEYDPGDARRFSGGDLAGVTRRLDYLRELGATAVWITPPVASQWWDGERGYGGYHGYWAEHFRRVDAHFGTLDDYRALSRGLHARGMFLIQDVVVNHTGNFFAWPAGWNADDPVAGLRPNPDSRPVPAPTQWPFRLNDARDPSQREAAIYHWTPSIVDFNDRRQELDFALADLDDLNTENAVVRHALRESYAYWIREIGVDAFRVDTAYHVPPDFFADFMHSDDPDAPGMAAVARATGRHDFLAFGEGFGTDRPFAEDRARKLETYVRDAGGRPLLSSMIDFPLYGSLGDVFARGRPPAELGHRIESRMRLHADPHRMPTFVDNHDVDRFLAGGSEAGLKQALLAILTLPGIPTLYYGTEQGFTQPRRAMFAGGHASGGRDHFDTQAPLFRYLQRAIALRRDHRVFSRGTPTVLRANAAAPGALAWRMDHGDRRALVIMNTSDGESLLDNLDLGAGANAQLSPLFAIDGDAPAQRTDATGRLSLRLPPRAGWVYAVDAGAVGQTDGSGTAALVLERRAASEAAPATRLAVQGSAPDLERLQLVLDGDLARAQPVTPDADGRWQAELDIASLVDPALEHRLVAWSDEPPLTSEPLLFRAAPQWQPLGEVDDPAGDDAGPDGRYRYPTDPGWAGRQADIRRMRAFGSGGSLRIEIDMASHSAGWNPPNGFDRVALTLFIELPDRAGGARLMPLQNARLPDGLRWHYRLRAGGWSNALFSAEGASATNEGRALAGAARIEVEPESARIVLILPADALGNPATLAGARLHLTTWDYDGRYRDLQPEPGPHAFGGGGPRDAKVMDAATLVLR